MLILFTTTLLGVVGLGLDFGAAFLARAAAAKISEAAAHRAVSELYREDYVDLGVVAPANWNTQLNDTNPGDRNASTARRAAADLADDMYVGWNADGSPHAADVQENFANDPAGDLVLGRWKDGGPPSFVPYPGPTVDNNAELPNSARVFVRRTAAAAVGGVSMGNNPLPVSWLAPFFPGPLEITRATTVALQPAAVIGPGAVVRRYDPASPTVGRQIRTGAMPFVVILRPAVLTWLTTNNPASSQQIDIDNTGALDAGAEGFFTNYGILLGGGQLNVRQFNAINAMLDFLRGVSTVRPPPRVMLGDLPNRPALTAAQNDALLANLADFQNRTMVVPVLANNDGATPGAVRLRVIGFARIYCTSVNAGARRAFFRLAPSAHAQNAGTLATRARALVPPAMPPAGILTRFNNTFFISSGGFPVMPRRFGVACASATVRYNTRD